MVTIRLARGGSKKRPFYRIVVADNRAPRDGRYVERLGYYNPLMTNNSRALHIAENRAHYWIAQGAKPSKKVQYLIKKAKKEMKTTPLKQTEAA